MRRWVMAGGEQGTALVELALLGPFLFVLLFGIIEMGSMFNGWVSVQNAAELGGRYAVTGRTTCTSGGSGRSGCIVSEARTGLSHMQGGSSAPVTMRSWAYPSYTTVRQNDPGQQCDAVEVQVDYNYQMRAPIIRRIKSSVTLTGRQRFINEPFGTCQ